MIVVYGHAGDEDAVVTKQAPPEFDITIRRQDRVEPPCPNDRLPPVGAVPTVDIWRARQVTFGGVVHVPGTERLVIIDRFSQLGVEVDAVGSHDSSAEGHHLRVGIECANQIGEPSSSWHAVVVKKSQDIAFRNLDSSVSRPRDPHPMLDEHRAVMGLR